MVKLITISKDGKLTLPKEVRKEMGLTGEEEFVLVADSGNIIIKKIYQPDRQQLANRMKELTDEFGAAFKKAKITKKDVAKEIEAGRAQNY